ncbi:unnamed protein product [Pieris macdunnoughi]|uniref:Uncharacterized protein n=1 Tax=Pieris macdunnoughi TaxID=345717 RepID=A0A821LGV7_9NEOP|nr:unnamed protein product [Pieris macdunnoughi]
MSKRGQKSRYIRVVLKAGLWKRVPMKLFKWSRKMSLTRQYDLVDNDEYDTKMSLHPEEAFEYGIAFHAKSPGLVVGGSTGIYRAVSECLLDPLEYGVLSFVKVTKTISLIVRLLLLV